MRIAAAVVGLLGGLFGFFGAALNTWTGATMILFADGGDIVYLLLETALLLFYLAALVASAVVLPRPRIGTVLLVACTIGVIVFGGLELYLDLLIPDLIQQVSPLAFPLLYPVTAAPFLLVASVFAFLANRRGERSLA